MSRRNSDAAQAGPEPVSDRADIVTGLLLALLAGSALLWLIPYHTEAPVSRYDIAPGFFPSLAAWAVLVLSVGLIGQRLLRFRHAAGLTGGGNIVIEIVIWSITALLIGLGLNTIGFLITATVLIAAGMYFAGYRNGWLIAAIAMLFPLLIDQAAWQVFTVGLP